MTQSVPAHSGLCVALATMIASDASLDASGLSTADPPHKPSVPSSRASQEAHGEILDNLAKAVEVLAV